MSFFVKAALNGTVTTGTVGALVSDHLGNSEKWSRLELVAYETGLRKQPHDETIESGHL